MVGSKESSARQRRRRKAATRFSWARHPRCAPAPATLSSLSSSSPSPPHILISPSGQTMPSTMLLQTSSFSPRARPSQTPPIPVLSCSNSSAAPASITRSVPQNTLPLLPLLPLQVQEILLFHHLALLTSRIYVYQPFVWRPRGEMSFVPLSAFLWGPTAGTISSAVFDEACSADDTKHISLRAPHAAQWDHAKEALGGDEPCIVVDDWILNWRLCLFAPS